MNVTVFLNRFDTIHTSSFAFICFANSYNIALLMEKNKIVFNNLLKSPIDFVCKSTTILPEDFATLALLNLLDERLIGLKQILKNVLTVLTTKNC